MSKRDMYENHFQEEKSKQFRAMAQTIMCFIMRKVKGAACKISVLF